MFRITSGQVSLMGFLDVLKQNGLVKVLAEPTLICRSGENADFLAGGEIPIPVPQGLGTVAIEYKKYGVTLGFTPTVVSDKLISMRVSPEVSELDYANVIEINGFTIPAISTRRAATTVELADGQSFAVAGLLRDEVRESIKKYPVLGDLPLLGTLFRSSNWQKNETELVIIVTPHLAKPLDGATAKLPTDGFREPSEFEFFLQGKMEGAAPVIAAPAAYAPGRTGADAPAGMEGEFGHVLPGHAQGGTK
jgi:pilus assembly protein CpaC